MTGLLLCLVFTAWAETQHNTVETYLQTAKASGKTPNNLIKESSPYLLQHAYNPVNWYAWGEEAFSRARQENKPIFLSIGYSTCHWCHVMAHESFENSTIAEILNKYYICVKVDREERPDVDTVYMSATQLVNGHGGWPMTIVMNHDLEPFFTGTYFPPDSANGRRGLKELLSEIHQLWKNDRPRVEVVARNIAAQTRQLADESMPGGEVKKDIGSLAMQQISNVYDKESGGFSEAPKFPRPGIFAYLLQQAKSGNANHKQALGMLNKTLTAMAQGGIYDQIGGGFHRYSVDAHWQVPHFEKMLYSQALLVTVYARLYYLEHKPLYKKVVQETLAFVLREMTSPNGGFYSALDADSERPDAKGKHAEGAFYLWNEEEIKTLLTDAEFIFLSKYFNIVKDGNIYSDPQGEFTNMNILHVNEDFFNIQLTKKQQKLFESSTNKLMGSRQYRPRPHLDDKVITAWNGMMVAAFVDAFEIFDDKTHLQAAINAAEFVRKFLMDKKTATLLRRVRGTNAGIDANLSDYVWTIRSLIKLYQATGENAWLKTAIKLSHSQNRLFLDKNNGGYFDASDQDSSLLFRSKSIYDGALPATNSIALSNLTELYKVTKNKQWKRYADNLLSTFSGAINNNPAATATALSFVGDN